MYLAEYVLHEKLENNYSNIKQTLSCQSPGRFRRIFICEKLEYRVTFYCVSVRRNIIRYQDYRFL